VKSFFNYRKYPPRPLRVEGKGLPLLFWEAAERWGEHPAFGRRITEGPSKGEFELITYREWRQRAIFLATGFLDIGIARQEAVGIFSDNCFEWMLAEAALQFCGAITVPRAADITPEELLYIIPHAGLKVILLQNRKLLSKLEKIRDQLSWPLQVVIMQGEEEQQPPVLISLKRLEHYGEKLWIEGDQRVEKRRQQTAIEDLYTIIYTSGTTGQPKGVELSHQSIMTQVELLSFLLQPGERTLSILPLWHSYERVFEVLTVAAGGCTYYSSLRHLAGDFAKVKPTMMASSPRLWESLYDRMMQRLAQGKKWQQHLFRSSVALAEQHAQLKKEQHSGSKKEFSWRRLWSATQYQLLKPLVGLLDALLLKKIRAVLGGKLRGTISGGGALPDYIDRFFEAVGIPIFEGYGLTESGPVVAVRLPEQFMVGTVGPMLPQTEVQIRDLQEGKVLYPDEQDHKKGKRKKGEIWLRGNQLMRGYRHQPQETAAALQEGWLRTGDIGMITEEGCLKIVGRCKETIVLLSGENVEPVPIESQLQSSSLIEQCMVVGQDQKYLGLLLIPSLEGVSHYLAEYQEEFPQLVEKTWSSLEELLTEGEVLRPLFDREIRKLIGAAYGFKTFERIGTWAFISKKFEIGEEMTPTYKLRRHIITEKYQKVIKGMYQ
jgi:long-chain acyl-CoA synthetase